MPWSWGRAWLAVAGRVLADSFREVVVVDRWIVTLFGLHGDHPPTDAGGLMAFARQLPTPELADILESQQWLTTDVHHYPFPSSRRRRSLRRPSSGGLAPHRG